MNHMELWNKINKPPTSALKAIQAGRLKGKSDINPQWRMQAITDACGPCGFGWRYTVDRLWLETGATGEVCAFASVSLHVKLDGEWSAPIPGIGGSMFIANEKNGPFTSDEAYKMATTDALSVAFKALGMAAEVYLGNFDGSKYVNQGQGRPAQQAPAQGQSAPSLPPDPKDAEYIDRTKKALRAIFGDDKAAALAKVEELTSFVPRGKTEAERVKGIRDFTKLTGQRLQILCHNLEKLLPPADLTELCTSCMQPMEGGRCRNESCPEGEPA